MFSLGGGSFKSDSGSEIINKIKDIGKGIVDKVDDIIDDTISFTNNNESESVDLTAISKASDKAKEVVKGSAYKAANPSTDMTKIDIPETDRGVYANDAPDRGRFGGDQGNIIHNLELYIDKPEMREIVSKYYSDFDSEDLELLFDKMNNTGCGYVAAITSILCEYGYFGNPNDFFEKFGFSMNNKDYSKDGEGISLNYEALFLDFYLYYAKNVMGFDTIEEVYGNIEEQMKYENSKGDGALNKSDFEITGMKGTFPDDISEILKQYLADKGIDLKIQKSIEAEPGTPAYEHAVKMLEEYGVTAPEGKKLHVESLDQETIKYYMNNKGCQIIVDGRGFNLYSTKDEDGNGFLDDIAYNDVGGHIMSIVGTTSDPNKVVVSSWGQEYVMNIDEIKDFTILDYSESDI